MTRCRGKKSILNEIEQKRHGQVEIEGATIREAPVTSGGRLVQMYIAGPDDVGCGRMDVHNRLGSIYSEKLALNCLLEIRRSHSVGAILAV